MGNCNSISWNPLIERALNGVQYVGQHLGWELVGRHITYVYCLERNLDSLEKVLESVGTLRKELIRRVKGKKGYGMQTNENVDSWMTRVEKKIATGDKLIKDRDGQVDRLCLAGICSTHYCSSSGFGRKVVDCVKELDDLKTEGKGFTEDDLVVNVAPELDLGAKMSCDSVGLEAKLDEVLTYLNQEDVGIVGVYGQGGVGKTTLLKDINNHYVRRRSENFLVVWIDVPKDVNFETIQQAIGGKIGLPDELKLSSMKEKSSYISKSLQQNKIILLLDDIREAIDLSEIGIPASDSLNNSKVVFTTRLEHACRQMKPQPGRITSVNILGPEQAWKLFEKVVGDDIINSHPQIRQLAEKVVEKCDGLPLALSLIGRAMSCEREPNVWKQTLRNFERPSLQQDSMTGLFSILRYSYDSLPNETYKSCFLDFALFPEACLLGKSRIIECWTFGDSSIDCDEDDLEAYRILSVLVSSCLLEDVKDYVRMHDVVRSMAIWIAKEDTLVMSGMELEEAPSVGKWSKMKRVSLMDNDIMELTQVPECPHLLTLFLNENEQLEEICRGFFESMGMLTVLDLSRTGITELPESISRLVSLKYLNLSLTKITELPIALIKLKALVYLDVNGVGNLRLSRKNQMFRHLSSLQYLGVSCYYYYYEEEGEEVRGISSEGRAGELLLEELQVLENLKVLEITLTSFAGLIKLFNNRRLLKRTRKLSLKEFTSLEPIDISLLAKSKHLDSFVIALCESKELKCSQESNLKSITSSVLTETISFNSLTAFTVAGCNYLEDITCVISMPNLRKLYVFSCDELREIISREKIGKGGEVYLIFSSLTTLSLRKLPMLKSIYPSNTLPLQFLYDLTVENCPQLKKLPLDPNKGVSGCSQIMLTAEQEWWDALEWKDGTAKVALLPRFNLYYLS